MSEQNLLPQSIFYFLLLKFKKEITIKNEMSMR